MALPNLPTQGQNPWYIPRTNWDIAVQAELEGRLSESTLNGTIVSIVNPAVEQALDDASVVTSQEQSQDSLRFTDIRGVPLLTIEDVNGRPHFMGTTPVDSVLTSGDSVRLVDQRGIPIAVLSTGTGSGNFRETHLICIWGQSNSLGWRSAPIPKYTNEPIPNLFMMPTKGAQSGMIVPGVDPLRANRTNDDIQDDARGFAIAYARWYALQNPDVRVIVVPNGVGGTGFRYAGGTDLYRWAIDLQDDVGVIPLYTEMVDRMNSVAAMYEPGSVRTVAILGQLGEADSVGLVTEAQYLADHVAFAAACRTDLPVAADALYLVGQTVWEFRNERMEGTYAEIDAATLDVPTQILRSGVALAPAGPGYARTLDDTHFTSEGQWLMSKSYIKAHEDALYNIT